MILARDKSWAFIHIPKTGGTNIRYNAMKYDHVIIADKHMPKHFNHQPISWWKSKGLIDNQTKLYSIVRNPYVRLASLYSHVSKRFDVSFKEFIFHKIPELNETELSNLEWKLDWSQSQFLDDDDVTVFKMEDSYCKLESIIRIKYCHTHFNKSKSYDISKIYCQETADFVFEHYEEDFRRFGYEHIRMQL